MTNQRKRLLAGVIIGAVLFVLVVVFLTSANRGPQGFENEFRVQRGTVDWHLAARGRVEGASSQEIKLASRVVGRLKDVLVNDGDPVKKDEVIAVLENNDLGAQVEQAKAGLAKSEADLEKVQNGARREEREAVRAQMDQAQADTDNAKLSFQRAQNLYKDGGIVSKASLDQAERDLKMSQARLETSRQNYLLIMAPPRPEDVAAAQAQRMLAKGQLAQAQDNYDNTFVRSPVNGVVVKRYMNPGESISYESLYQPIVSVSDTTHLMVRTEIDESDIGKIQIGQRADIHCDAYAGQMFHGTVVRISGGLGPKKIQTDNPTEKIDTDVLESFVEVDPGSPLRVGLRVDVYIQLAKKNNVLIVPVQAVEGFHGVPQVNVKTPQGVVSRKIGFGAHDGVNVEVTSGLQEGDVVVY